MDQPLKPPRSAATSPWPLRWRTLAAVIARIGDLALALGDDLVSLEVNPLRVDGSQIEALDAVIEWKGQL